MRGKITVALAASTAVLLSACGKNSDSSAHLLEKLDHVQIVCDDMQQTTDGATQTTMCTGFTMKVYSDQKVLAADLAKGSADPTVTGYNWVISAPDLQMARKIRSTVGGTLRHSITEGKNALDD